MKYNNNNNITSKSNKVNGKNNKTVITQSRSGSDTHSKSLSESLARRPVMTTTDDGKRK